MAGGNWHVGNLGVVIIMKIGFYSPYLDGVSGGERYVLALAGHWSRMHHVDVFWNDPTILEKARERLHVDIRKVHVVPNVFQHGNLLEKLLITRTYDLMFFLSDGSVPMSLAKHNMLHFQVPFASVSLHWWKLNRYDVIVCNSNFTKNNLDPALRAKASVIYPPVITKVTRSTKKEKIILSVGRFHPAKKQNVLIDAFKRMKQANWRLVCVGGLLPADKEYVSSLTRSAAGHSINIVTNGTYAELQSYYRKASLYWHAAGFGESDPKLQEHFGISTVEAMAYGCVPVVYRGGGLVEIVKEAKNGYLWDTPEEFINKTSEIIRNPSQSAGLVKHGIAGSRNFDETKFFTEFDELLTRITS